MKKLKDYPKKICAGGEEYKIIYTSRIKHCGDTNWELKRIRIKKGMTPRETLSTLIHELLHVAEFEHGVKLKHKTVYKLERAIMSFLLDNFFL